MKSVKWIAAAEREGSMTMQVSLEPKEQEILIWALEGTVSDLGAEIADTENQEFREDLKERKTVLRNILRRLQPG
jgi:hypothetical protein